MRDSVPVTSIGATYGFMQSLTTETLLPRQFPSLPHMESCSGPSLQDVMTQAALANLSQALDASLQHVELTFVYEMSYLRQSTINLVLLTVFFGLCTVLAIVAVYVLLSKDIKRRATALMLVAIVLLWASTTAYWIVNLVVTARVFSELPVFTLESVEAVADMQACLVSSWGVNGTFGDCPLNLPDVSAYLREASWTQDFASTTTTTISVVVGDAIIWWRAWVLWPRSYAVRLLCILMLLLTLVSGVVDAVLPAHSADSTQGNLQSTYDSTRLLLSGDVWAIVVCVASLLTSVTATSLIAYRAWQHRRAIMTYLHELSPRTQVERTLALLIESGLLYCGLWVLVTLYGVIDIFPNPNLVGFAKGFTYVMRGCLVPLIAMYPTLIIIICAVDKSLYEKSAHDAAQLGSIQFNAPLTRRRRGTLSELTSATYTYPGTDISGGMPDVIDDVSRVGPSSITEAPPSGGPLDRTTMVSPLSPPYDPEKSRT